MTLKMHPHPSAVPDTDRPPSGQNGASFPHHVVRLIPLDQAEPVLAEQLAQRSSCGIGLSKAQDRLVEARSELGDAKASRSRAELAALAAQEVASKAALAYERARWEVRRAEVELRQQQRRTDDAKVTLRQAYAAVARFEGLNGVPEDLMSGSTEGEG
jgi:hypothetical protein